MTPEMKLASMLSTAQAEPETEKTASVEDNSEELVKEKLAWADQMGREMARQHMEKVAINAAPSWMPAIKGVANKGMAVAKQGLGKVMHGATTAGLGTRMGVGAGVGAAAGGVAGAMKNPGVDPNTGKPLSRAGNIAAGIAGGAALGAGAGAAAKRGAMALGSSNTRVGRVAGQALKAEAKGTGNVAAQEAATAMQLGRGQRMAQAKVTRQAAPKPPAPAAPAVQAPAVQAPAAPAPAAARPDLAPSMGMTLNQARGGR